MLYRLTDDSINDQVVIDSPHATNYDSWQTNIGNEDIVVNYQAYLFDIQNPQDILNGAKPIVEQKGTFIAYECIVCVVYSV